MNTFSILIFRTQLFFFFFGKNPLENVFLLIKKKWCTLYSPPHPLLGSTLADQVNPCQSFTGRFWDLLNNWQRCASDRPLDIWRFLAFVYVFMLCFVANWKQKSWKTGTNHQVKWKISINRLVSEEAGVLRARRSAGVNF